MIFVISVNTPTNLRRSVCLSVCKYIYKKKSRNTEDRCWFWLGFRIWTGLDPPDICYLSLPSTRQDLTQGQWLEGRLLWDLGEGGRARAEDRALLDNAGRGPTSCNVGLMSLAGPGMYAWLQLKLDHGVQSYTRGTKVSMMQLVHSKVAWPKPAAFRSQFCQGALTV